MKILVVGASGQVGSQFFNLRHLHRHEFIGVKRADFDLRRPERFMEVLDAFEPDAIINAAGYTDCDQAENNQEMAATLNVTAPRVMADCAARFRLPFFHLSSDYIFDGSKERPYKENDPAHPLNVYGETKYKGEQEVLSHNPNAIVLRTSWVFSASHKNFLKAIVNAARANGKIKVVDDQYGCPTLADDLAIVCVQLLENQTHSQILHFSGSTAMTWFDFAKIILSELPNEIISSVEPCSTEEYGRTARRPHYSVLSNGALDQLMAVTRTDINVAIKSCISKLPS